MQGLCDSCEESADHLFDLTRLPEFQGIVRRLNYRNVCQICYDDLYDEVKQPENPSDRRSETRYPIRLKINLAGVDRGGQKFSEQTFTEDVSLSGARIKITNQVESGTVLNIAIPEANFEAAVIIEIIWQDGQAKTAGLKLVESNESWVSMVSTRVSSLDTN